MNPATRRDSGLSPGDLKTLTLMRIPTRLLPGILCGFLAVQLWATDREIDVAITPSTLARENTANAILTVHANVPLADVIPDSARLIAILPPSREIILEPLKVFADDCGDLVAKFDATPVKDALKPRGAKNQQITLVFSVTKEDDSIFFGSDTVRVK
jgi:hypothetical protein